MWLGHRDIKNADNLGHRDTETVDINMCGQTDTLKGTNRQTGERRKKKERRKVGSRSRQDFGDLKSHEPEVSSHFHDFFSTYL